MDQSERKKNTLDSFNKHGIIFARQIDKLTHLNLEYLLNLVIKDDTEKFMRLFSEFMLEHGNAIEKKDVDYFKKLGGEEATIFANAYENASEENKEILWKYVNILKVLHDRWKE